MEEFKHNIGSEAYWTNRYLEEKTGWDIGYVSTPLKEYFDTLLNKDLLILIPGCGNAYEAAYLFEKGFKNVFLLDISEYPLSKFKIENPDFPEENLIHSNFFEHSGKYDLIIEQTFFCALNPDLREDYCKKMQNLLSDEGKLTGVLFNIPLNSDHPPYGGKGEEYEPLFEKYFEIEIMEKCRNSIPPRMGNELFFCVSGKKH